MTEPQSVAELDAAAPAPPARPPRVPKAARRWILESVLIVASVLLGFGLNEFRLAQAERELTARMLDGVRAEIEHNLGVLEPFISMHTQWVDALEGADVVTGHQSGLDVWFATRPPFPPGSATSFPFLRRSAWDAAVAGGALRLIDYDVAAALTDVYGMQELATANLQRLANGPLTTPAIYDPASRAASVRLLWLTLADIQSAEVLLLARYREHFPAISAAAAKYR
jgi:hypothetical protein